ncbi:TlpA family protein disulfide reductase [Jiulongibacter sp. NS-SX5]|uniref:TlpA family protein disulfide reductase n=1 Tax=Jiulongibacter sp. NS-SX5 TaxID=3463854 RepID=UPI004059272C
MKPLLLLLFALISLNVSAQNVGNFELKDINNQYQTYEDLKGEKLTLIDFWATWCKPCMKAIPELKKIYSEYQKEGVEIIGISCDGPRSVSKVSPLSKSLGIEYPVLIDIDAEIKNDLNLSAFPSLIFVDNNGEIVWVHEGYLPGDSAEIREKLVAYLNEH